MPRACAANASALGRGEYTNRSPWYRSCRRRSSLAGSSMNTVLIPEPDSRLLPDLPGRVARGPAALEHLLLLEGVHARPESVVLESHELAGARERLERLALPDRLVARDVVDRLGLEYEEPAVDPALARRRLLVELRDAL